MVGTSLSIFSPGIRGQLLATKQTARTYDAIQNTIATGKNVNSAIDGASRFFTSSALTSQANDLNRVLDNISLAVRTIRTAETALSSVDDVLTEANDLVQEANGVILSNQKDVGEIILEDEPVVYYRLNDTNTNIVTNLGTGGNPISGRYQGGVTLDTGPLHQGIDNASASFDGNNDRIRIPNSTLVNRDPNGYAQRTVEITFEAASVSGRQVLFESGGNGNDVGFSIYLDDDDLYFAVNDPASFGLLSVKADINIQIDEVHHASFVFNSDEGAFTGYLDGQDVGEVSVNDAIRRHGTTALGRASNGAVFHDGVSGGNAQYFEGRLSDFAIYNTALTQTDIQERYDATQLSVTKDFEQRINTILQNLDPFVDDTSFLGVNLLNGDDLSVYFNSEQTSNLNIQGRKLYSSNLGLNDVSLQTNFDLKSTVRNFDSATDSLKEYISSLSRDLSIIENRREYTQSKINTLRAGSDDLVLADQNEAGANLIAAATRQTVQLEVLALSSNPATVASLL